MQNEKAVKDQIKKLFKVVEQDYPGKLYWFMPPANGFGRSGIPDFVGWFAGHSFVVEAKSGAGTTTAHQDMELAKAMQAGARGWIVREASMDAFQNEFRAWVALCS